MRLHRLDVAAFGPYPGRESVDFDALGADGLFLLHGDTGAGKTTLLDAVAFALFGRVPGARNDVKRLRCDTAGADELTQVTLELTVQGHRLRIERSPEYQRPKKRGEGFTTQPAKAALTWLDVTPGGEPSEGLSRVDEVARTVERLLGMNADQFLQVVMLPQGEFARFLRAETSEREKLLEKLFGTQRFGEVESWFAERRKERGQELKQQKQQVQDLLARVSQAAGVDAAPPDDEQNWLEDLEKRLTRDAEEARAERERLGRARESAEAELARGRELAEKVRRVRQAHADLAELDGQRAQHEQWRAEKEAAERGSRVRAYRESAGRAAEERERAVAEVRAAVAQCSDVDTASSDEQLRGWVGSWREQAGGLAQLIPEAQQQVSDRERLAALERSRQADERAELRLAEQQAAQPEQVRLARERWEAAKQADLRWDVVVARVEELEALRQLARELPQAQRTSESAATVARESVDRHQRARERLQQLRERRLAGMAAELAGTLESGQACPVCGSPEHPVPGRPVDEQVTADDEEQARTDEQTAHAQRERATAHAQQAEQECGRLRERLGEWTEQELDRQLAESTAERDDLRQRTGSADQRAQELADVEASGERIATQVGDVRTRIASTRTEIDTLQTTVEERESRLREARGEYADIADRRTALLDQVERVDRLLIARAAGARAENHLDEQRTALREAAGQAGFDSVEAAAAAEREDRRVAELDEMLAEAQRRRAVARATLDTEELADVDPQSEVGLDEAAAAAQAARQAAEGAAAAARSTEQRCADVAQLAERLRGAWNELGPVLAEQQELEALTELVHGRGQNARKMSLRSYVLAARLEEVAIAGTRRLQRMSDGRYSFVHTDEAGKFGTRGGLGLDVLDDYSGKVRPTKTLSGGESFLASLALALGLADVVAGETGGAVLDTLFIDEGFGSLDADTLDLVMDTLDELRAGGRVIGLVSHVDEMRQRIPFRLHVRKSRYGSTLDFVS